MKKNICTVFLLISTTMLLVACGGKTEENVTVSTKDEVNESEISTETVSEVSEEDNELQLQYEYQLDPACSVRRNDHIFDFYDSVDTSLITKNDNFKAKYYMFNDSNPEKNFSYTEVSCEDLIKNEILVFGMYCPDNFFDPDKTEVSESGKRFLMASVDDLYIVDCIDIKSMSDTDIASFHGKDMTNEFRDTCAESGVNIGDVYEQFEGDNFFVCVGDTTFSKFNKNYKGFVKLLVDYDLKESVLIVYAVEESVFDYNEAYSYILNINLIDSNNSKFEQFMRS